MVRQVVMGAQHELRHAKGVEPPCEFTEAGTVCLGEIFVREASQCEMFADNVWLQGRNILP